MKIGKKTAMGLSIVIGTIMFGTTAFAEVTSKSGYDQLKDALKYTSSSCTKLSSFTLNYSEVVKDNGTVIEEIDQTKKYDNKNYETESRNTTIGSDGTSQQNYSYNDKNTDITNISGKNVKNSDVYYEVDYPNGKDTSKPLFNDPFSYDRAGDYEKIADALVGNLKDSVVVTENSDGTKDIKGTITEEQIPAIANALVSFESKNIFKDSKGQNGQNIYPNITKDIYVKEVKGDILVDKDGFIKNIIGDVIITGEDDKGKSHDITYELLGKITDVNNTKITKPNLQGKDVNKTSIQYDGNVLTNPSMYLGTYRSDIIIIKDGKFKKIGEQILDIKSLDNKTLTASYKEQYLNGYESYAKNAKDFTIIGKTDSKNPGDYKYTSRDTLGNEEQGDIYVSPGEPYVGMNFANYSNGDAILNGQLFKVIN